MTPKKIISAQRKLSLERSRGDELIDNFNFASIMADIDKMEAKKSIEEKRVDSVFNNEKFETVKRLVQADAITNVVQLEQRLKDERKTMVKNRAISLQKMIERHRRENAESSVDANLSRQEDDRIRIEEHFAKEIEVLESKQRMEFAFNTERMISDSARGRLKKVDFCDLEQSAEGWVDVAGEEEQHESFTVNLGNQLKITQNIRLVKCNLIDELRVRRGIAQRLESLINLASERPAAIILPFEKDDLSFTNTDFVPVRTHCLEMTDVVFPSFDKQIEEARTLCTDIQSKRFFTTRHSILSANAHIIFHLYVGKVNLEKSIESRHPTLLALRTIIRECSRVCLLQLILYSKDLIAPATFGTPADSSFDIINFFPDKLFRFVRQIILVPVKSECGQKFDDK